jgi:hypothetical protein
MPESLYGVHETHDIAVDEHIKIFQRISFLGLGSQVYHAMEFFFSKQLFHHLPVTDISFDETKLTITLKPSNTRLL